VLHSVHISQWAKLFFIFFIFKTLGVIWWLIFIRPFSYREQNIVYLMQKQKKIHKDSESWYKDRGGQGNKKKKGDCFVECVKIWKFKINMQFFRWITCYRHVIENGIFYDVGCCHVSWCIHAWPYGFYMECKEEWYSIFSALKLSWGQPIISTLVILAFLDTTIFQILSLFTLSLFKKRRRKD
jgi:hypothetical protein